MTQSSHSGHPRRPDIQILRGYAVLLVLLYHAGFKLLPGGFVGVDIFFVISGFLITGIIRRDLSNGSFSLLRFYARRAKRLFPAAYVVFFLTALVSPYLLTSTEFQDFEKQLTGALSFTANYVLKNQTGYFDGAADLKPLLHTWSLSVEEQFYFLIPAILILLSPRWHHPFFLFLLSASLAGCFLAKANPETIFYTLPYRAWELALGAVGAHYAKTITTNKPQWRIGGRLSWIILLLIPLVSMTRAYPEVTALLAGMATAFLLVSRTAFQKAWFSVAMMRVGDFSYSLYLIHWPLFSYFNNILIETNPLVPWIRTGLIITAVITAFFLYRYVEIPFLNREIRGRKVFGLSLLGAMLLIGLMKLQSYMLDSSDYWRTIRSPSVGFDNLCATAGPINFKDCRNSPSPRYVIWGDSMAMQLVNGVSQSRKPLVPLIQATRHACAPFIGIADYRNKSDRRYLWETSCIDFNDQVIRELSTDTERKTIILSGNLLNMLKPERLLVYRSPETGKLYHADSNPAEVLNAVKHTVLKIREAGHRVILIAQPPQASFDVSRCLERKGRSLLTFGADSNCRIKNEMNDELSQRLNRFLQQLKTELEVDTLRFDDFLCHDDVCETTFNGIPLYRDNTHLTNIGGVALIKKMDLIISIDSLAK